MPKNNKLSIYKIKQNITDINKIVKSFSYKKEILGVGDFYYNRSSTHSPDWIEDFFVNEFTDPAIFSASSQGVLILKIEYQTTEIFFALPFGMGRHMLELDSIEERFGLIVTLNCIQENSIRSLEKRTLGANPKIAKEQMGKPTRAVEFGIDIEQDLIRMVTGKSKFPDISKNISGADVLSVTAKVNIKDIQDYLKKCYERYLSDDYKKDFDWVDQIHEIRDSNLLNKLNQELLNKLNARELAHVWMAIPDLIEWTDVKGFNFLPRQKELSSDIDIFSFIDSFTPGIDSIEKLKSRHIAAISEKTEEVIEYWTAYKCMYGEIELDNIQYILNNGKWYEINNGFVASVNKEYELISLSTMQLPDYNHASEGAYTKSTCGANALFQSMDADNIVYGGGKSKIEFCDIYTQDKKIIHIKPYAASSVLSHLFQQGLVSGELLVSDAEFRKTLNKKLKTGWKLNNPSVRIKPGEYEIIYAIISNKADARPVIPFFSRVSIKNAKRRLESFGYNVSIMKIQSLK